jgi:maleate isomerase
MTAPYRVGLIVPSSNVTMETELPALLAGHAAAKSRGVTFHSSRAALHQVNPTSLSRMVTESERCANELADARVDIVAYACLIAVMAEGPGAHEAGETRLAEILTAAGSAAPVTSSAGALVRALQRLGAERIAIVTPYLRSLTEVVVSYLAGYGIRVVDSMSLEVADNVEVGRLDPARLIGYAETLDLTHADAVVLSACVQMPSLPAIEQAGRVLGLPVLSAATATASEVLALLGEQPLIPGAGAALAPVPAAAQATHLLQNNSTR